MTDYDHHASQRRTQRDPRAIAEALARLNPAAARGYVERAEKREKIEQGTHGTARPAGGNLKGEM